MPPSPPPIPDNYKYRVLVSVVFGVFMVVLDSTVVNVAFQTLRHEYGASLSDAQWIISLYVLALGVATPVSGFLADRFGIKRTYITGLAGFVAGSLLCGLAPSLRLLVAARALQGLAGGIALPLGSAQLLRAFPPHEQGKALGLFGIVLVFAPAIGPVLGGALVDAGLWRWIFFINVPIGVFGVLLAFATLAELVSNERPLAARYQGELFFPIVSNQPETTFGGDFRTPTDWHDPFIRERFAQEGNWALFTLNPYSANSVNYFDKVPAPAPPSRQNLLGTDDSGRDMAARLLYGFRVSVWFGFALTSAAVLLGVLMGALQGYFGGRIDLGAQRLGNRRISKKMRITKSVQHRLIALKAGFQYSVRVLSGSPEEFCAPPRWPAASPARSGRSGR